MKLLFLNQPFMYFFKFSFPKYLFLFSVFSSLNLYSQNKIYIATARLNQNTITYTKKISSDVEFIDFMNINIADRDSLLQRCSGLLLVGGLDIDPSRFNKKELKKYCEIDESRDSVEFALLKWADNHSAPILGICRGMQFINVYFGGTLCVDIPTFCKSSVKNEKHRDSQRKKDVFHEVIITENTELAKCYGDKKSILVNSFHHQCVDELGKTLKISAKSPGGIVEGIENDNNQRKSFVLGVQWHPERFFTQDQANLKILERFLTAVAIQE
jgi:putative glutamine amidotransferase